MQSWIVRRLAVGSIDWLGPLRFAQTEVYGNPDRAINCEPVSLARIPSARVNGFNNDFFELSVHARRKSHRFDATMFIDSHYDVC
jgi:hypothetical protein